MTETKAFLDRLNNLALVRFLLLFASGWAGLQLLRYFEIVVVVFASAAILAFLLEYPVRWCRRFMPHSLAVTLVFLLGLVGFGGVLGGIAIAVVTQGQGLTASIGDFLSSLTPTLAQLEDTLQQINLQVDLQPLGDQLRDQTVGLLGAGFGILQALLENFITGILIAVVTYFMLLDGARLWHLALKALPTHRRRRITVTVQKNLLGFFWGRLLLSIFFGVSTFVVFLLLKVPYALTLAVIAGLFDLIPGIGATIGISLVGLLLLSQSVWLTIQSFIICILLQQVEENVLLPRIMQDSLNINPVVMFFALIVGARVAGVLGVFLAIPIAGIIISLLEIDEMKGHPMVKE
ncbi:MAG: AI-2E family transporter [Cyanobacteria bacterium J06632_22]